ncbi:MAG: hypothetical protein NUW01_13950 [Gemmatimonadaceae bacterium]|nr:hypothetical protein [Gemmatimonadaceae bacterium]
MTRPRKASPAIAGPPRRKREGPGGFLLSAFVHATLVLLLLTSPFSHGFTPPPSELGGGPGPAGGGGGRSGSGADGERLRFVQTRPAALPPAPAPALVPSPPISTPVPPVVAPSVQPVAEGPPSGTATSGTGTAGQGGAGPGSGGGTGSGTGTGTGSGTGPGTGGGDGVNHPPTPTQVFLPPLPAPPRIKPYHLIAWFEVDERGKARLLSFNPSRDASYNRRLREVLLSLKFRPGVTPAGVPVRDTIDIQFVF